MKRIKTVAAANAHGDRFCVLSRALLEENIHVSERTVVTSQSVI